MMRQFFIRLIGVVAALVCLDFVQAQGSGSGFGSGAGSGSGGFPNGSSFPWDIFPDFFKFAFNNGDFLNATFLFDLPLAPTQFDAVLTQVPEGLSGSVFYPAGYASSCGTGNAVATETKTCVDSLNTCSAARGDCNAMKTCVTAYINCLEAASVSLVAQDTGKCSWPSAWVFSGKSSKELNIPVPDCTAFYANFQRLHFSTGCPAFDQATGTPGVDLFLECIAATSRLAAGVVQKLPRTLKKTQLRQDRNTLFVRGLPPVVMQSRGTNCNTTAAKCPRPNVDGSCTCTGRNKTLSGMYHSSYLYSSTKDKCSRAPVDMTVCLDEVQDGADDPGANISFAIQNITNVTRRAAAANRMAGVLEAAGAADCDAGRTPRRFKVLSKVEGANEPVGRELLVCAPPDVNVFIQSESTGACYQPIENQTCNCDGKTSNAWSVVYVNTTNDASTSGNLITCALYTPPPTAQAITTASAAFASSFLAAGAAKNIQMASAATMIDCHLPPNRTKPVTVDGSAVPGFSALKTFSTNAQRAGGDVALTPFSLSNSVAGKLAWLLLVMILPFFIHGVIAVIVALVWHGVFSCGCKKKHDNAEADAGVDQKEQNNNKTFGETFADVAAAISFPSGGFITISFTLQGVVVESTRLLRHHVDEPGALGTGIVGVVVIVLIAALHIYVGWRVETDLTLREEGWMPYENVKKQQQLPANKEVEGIEQRDPVMTAIPVEAMAGGASDQAHQTPPPPPPPAAGEVAVAAPAADAPSAPSDACGIVKRMLFPDGRWMRDRSNFRTVFGMLYAPYSGREGNRIAIAIPLSLMPTLVIGVAAGWSVAPGPSCDAAMSICIIAVSIYCILTIWYRPSVYLIDDVGQAAMSALSAILLILVVSGSEQAEVAYLLQIYIGITVLLISTVLQLYQFCFLDGKEAERRRAEQEKAQAATAAEQKTVDGIPHDEQQMVN